MSFSRRHFLFGSLALPALAAKKTGPERPNVVLIFADQLPAWTVGCYGNKEIHTPNIDKLAQTGTRFHNHFAATPQAVISRATIRTGRTPMQIGPAGTPPAADATLEKILGAGGYQCHTTDRMPGEQVAADAGKFLDAQAAGKPFLLTVGFSDLTPPYDGTPQKFVDLYTPATFVNYSAVPAAANARAGKEMLSDVDVNLRKVAATISCIDGYVGGIVTKLYQKQLMDNTLVLFTSPCGSLFGRHGLWDSGDASDPVNMYDETIQVPMIWTWPHRFPPMGKQIEMVSTYDLLPTVCDLLSLETPDRLCGRSYLLLGEGKKLPKKHPWRTTVCGHYQNTDMAREERYKVVLRNDGKGPNELYDLSTDPGEKTNQYDNDQYADVRTRLQTEITRWKQNFSS